MKRTGILITSTLSIIVVATIAVIIFARPQQETARTDSVDTVSTASTMAQPEGVETTDSKPAGTTKLLIGNPEAAVTIVEYLDYKCPNCGKLHQNAMKDIRKNYIDTGKVNIEVRPFPLFGEDSGLALYASYCAAEQGKFAAYHDKIFDYMWTNYYRSGDYSAEGKKLFSPERLGQLAGEAGLDAAAFTTCAGGTTHGDAYNAAVHKAAGDSVQATPTIIIGGQKVVGPQPYSTYDALLKIETL